jgi:hypothetical protein
MSKDQITLQEYHESPWENRSLHPSYRNSFLNFSNAPEYAPSEVLLASLYRRIGLRQSDGGRSLPEGSVGKNGTALMRAVEKRISKGEKRAGLSVEGWECIIDDVMRSPRQPNQRAKRFVQMTPIVPSTAIYSMAARLRGNPWNPGGLIESCVGIGEKDEERANRTWHKLFGALSVKEYEDDVWAVFLEREFAEWNSNDISWEFSGKIEYEEWMRIWQGDQIACPARRLVRDLLHLVKAKPCLTRRQWTSALESVLRMGLGAHVLWISKVNSGLYKLAEGVLKGGLVPSLDTIRQHLSTGDGFWSYGQAIGSHIKRLIRDYLTGRVGLNMLLYRCQEVDGLTSLAAGAPFGSLQKIHGFLEALSGARVEFDFEAFELNFDAALEADPRKLAIKQGVGKNMEEFLRHSLGQRETQERGLESYDQGYLLSRKSSYSRAPWVLAAGPVMILTLAFVCTNDGSGVRTVEDLCKHLGEYGVKISPDEVANSELGASLRTLGLTLDSPDAEGGMVLLDPFSSHSRPDLAD